jgi:hypothetical protein
MLGSSRVAAQVAASQEGLSSMSEFRVSRRRKTQLLPTLRVRVCQHALSDVFGDRIISSVILPARSSHLNPCDFFLLGLFEVQSLQQ